MSKEKDPIKQIQEGIEDTSKKLKDEVSDKSRDIWLAGLGVLSTVEEEGTKIFSRFVELGKGLVEKGEEYEKRQKDEGVGAKIEDSVKFVEDKVKSAMEPLKFSSRDEIKDLNSKVDNLAEKVAALVDKLESNGKGSRKS